MRRAWILFAIVLLGVTILACGGSGGGGGGDDPAAGNLWNQMHWNVGKWGP